MARRTQPKRRFSRRAIRRRIKRVRDRLAELGSAWDMSNGMLRYRVRLLERELQRLLDQLRD